MTRRTLYRTIATIVMLALLALLLAWQQHRDRLVSDCVDQGGTWDGRDGRCKLLPPIYLERGIKRSETRRGSAGPRAEAPQKRSIR